MVKTRNKQIDTRDLLELSSNRKNEDESLKTNSVTKFKAKYRILRSANTNNSKKVQKAVSENLGESSTNLSEQSNSSCKENDASKFNLSKNYNKKDNNSLRTTKSKKKPSDKNVDNDGNNFKKPDTVLHMLNNENKARYSFEASLPLRPSATSTPSRPRSEIQLR